MHGLHHQSAVDERCNNRGQWGRYSYGRFDILHPSFLQVLRLLSETIESLLTF